MKIAPDRRHLATALPLFMAACVAVALVACDPGPTGPLNEGGSGEGEEPSLPPGLVLSDPLGRRPVGLEQAALLDDPVAWISARPGTFEEATRVVITNATSENVPARGVDVVDGGFDPVAVEARAGDELRLDVSGPAGPIELLWLRVPEDRPPTVVRTVPPGGRTDVAFLVQPRVVFTEPIDSASLEPGAIRLLRGGEAVPAQVTVDAEDPLTARLIPESPLAPETAYVLVITTAVRDLGGDALESEVQIAFRTGQAKQQIAIVSGTEQAGSVGAPLEDSLVVRVSDFGGAAIEGMTVVWYAYGMGALDGFAADGSPIDSLVTRTDTNGLARASLVPTAFTRVRTEAWCETCDVPFVTFVTTAEDRDATARRVSGDDQVADAGQPGQPLVVRVVDGEGTPVAHAGVQWQVVYGRGAFDADSVVDRTRTWSDADGLARVPVVPLWFGPVDVEVRLDGQDRPSASAFFVVDASDPGATIEIVSGDGQVGRAMDELADPLVVRVVNGRGEPVERVTVDWTSGPTWGDVWWAGVTGGPGLVAGLDSARFTPEATGEVWAEASLPGLPDHRVTFGAVANTFVIWLWVWEEYHNIHYLTGNVFNESCWTTCTGITQVPVGTPVEWVLWNVPEGHIVSTSVPSGGASFDSGVLTGDDTFTFVPQVAGTWTFVDRISGHADGILIVN